MRGTAPAEYKNPFCHGLSGYKSQNRTFQFPPAWLCSLQLDALAICRWLLDNADMSDSPAQIHKLAAELADLASQGASSVASYLRAATRTVPAYATKKDQHDPVTVHDRAVESSLHQYFQAAVPGSRVLGEEMGERTLPARVGDPLGDSARQLADRVRWIIDPIDGTANFASGSTYFGTSVAVELDGAVVAAAISIPYTDELFVANLQEAWHLDRYGERTSLHSTGPLQESQAVLLGYYPSIRTWSAAPQQALRHQQDLTEAYMAIRRPGAAALDLAMVAAGWAGAALGTTFGPWDVAAGIHLVKVAGGQVLNLPMGSNLPDGLRPGVLATVRSLDAPVAKRILREANQEARTSG